METKRTSGDSNNPPVRDRPHIIGHGEKRRAWMQVRWQSTIPGENKPRNTLFDGVLFLLAKSLQVRIDAHIHGLAADKQGSSCTGTTQNNGS